MKKVTNFGRFALLFVAIASAMLACEKKQTPEEFRPSRFFAPAGLVVTAPNVFVDVSWSAPLYSLPSDGLNYTVQVARDSSFQSIEKEMNTESQTVRFVNTELEPDVSYVARVRANASGNIEASNWSITEPFSVTN